MASDETPFRKMREAEPTETEMICCQEIETGIVLKPERQVQSSAMDGRASGVGTIRYTIAH